MKALLIYSDPHEDGFTKGATAPRGPWRPESHIQRGAISYDFIVPDDPLTPGWASVDGAKRIAASESRAVPNMIAVPLSARDARALLAAIKFHSAPSVCSAGNKATSNGRRRATGQTPTSETAPLRASRPVNVRVQVFSDVRPPAPSSGAGASGRVPDPVADARHGGVVVDEPPGDVTVVCHAGSPWTEG